MILVSIVYLAGCQLNNDDREVRRIATAWDQSASAHLVWVWARPPVRVRRNREYEMTNGEGLIRHCVTNQQLAEIYKKQLRKSADAIFVSIAVPSIRELQHARRALT